MEELFATRVRMRWNLRYIFLLRLLPKQLIECLAHYTPTTYSFNSFAGGDGAFLGLLADVFGDPGDLVHRFLLGLLLLHHLHLLATILRSFVTLALVPAQSA